MNSRVASVMVLVLLVLTGLACNTSARVGVTVDENFTTITVTMDESEVVGLVADVMTAGQPPLFTDPVADLRAGEIYVSGTYQQRVGGGAVPGEMTVRLAARDGELVATVTSFNAAGVTAPQADLDAFNEELAARMGRRAARRESDARLSNVTITDTTLSFSLQIPREQ